MMGCEAEADWGVVRQRIANAIVYHRHFEETKRKVLRGLKTRNLVLLVGASGVGKTTLVREMVRELNRDVEDDRLVLRAVYVRMPSAHGAQYGWTDVYRRWADAVGEVLIDKKVDRQRIRRRGAGRSPSAFLHGTVDVMRDRVFQATVDRGVKVVFVDELANLLSKKQGKTERGQLDILRNMCDESLEVGKTLEEKSFALVLFASLSIVESKALKLSPELNRRAKKIIFPRYDPEVDVGSVDFREFAGVVKALVNEIPEKFRPVLSVPHVRELLKRSLGCVGILSTWLLDAIALYEDDDKARRLEWRHFESEEAGLSDGDVEDMANRAKVGEAAWEVGTKGNESGCSGDSAPRSRSSGGGVESSSGGRPKRPGKGIGVPAPDRLPTGPEGA